MERFYSRDPDLVSTKEISEWLDPYADSGGATEVGVDLETFIRVNWPW